MIRVLLLKKLIIFCETGREDVTYKTCHFNLVSHSSVNYYLRCCTEECIIVLKHSCSYLVMGLELVISNY